MNYIQKHNTKQQNRQATLHFVLPKLEYSAKKITTFTENLLLNYYDENEIFIACFFMYLPLILCVDE